jgi:hypothetical protein
MGSGVIVVPPKEFWTPVTSILPITGNCGLALTGILSIPNLMKIRPVILEIHVWVLASSLSHLKNFEHPSRRYCQLQEIGTELHETNFRKQWYYVA